MLPGSDLLTKVKELSNACKSELVRECGYVSTKKDGTERLNFTAFYEALLEAKGVTLGEAGQSRGQTGRKLSYKTKVQFNGNLLVGKAYTPSWALSLAMNSRLSSAASRLSFSPSAAATRTSDPPPVEAPTGLPH